MPGMTRDLEYISVMPWERDTVLVVNDGAKFMFLLSLVVFALRQTAARYAGTVPAHHGK